LQFLACEFNHEETFETVKQLQREACWNSWSFANEFPELAPCYPPEISTTLNALLSSLFVLAKFSELAESIFKMAKHMCLLCFLVDKLLQAFFGNIARFFYWVFSM
jgi:hypothetical protein